MLYFIKETDEEIIVEGIATEQTDGVDINELLDSSDKNIRYRGLRDEDKDE